MKMQKLEFWVSKQGVNYSVKRHVHIQLSNNGPSRLILRPFSLLLLYGKRHVHMTRMLVFIQNDRSSWIYWHGFHPMPLCWKDYSQSRGGVLSIGKLQQENLNKIWVRMILYCSKCYRYGNFPFVGIHLHQNNSFIWLGKVRDSGGPITRFQPTSIKLRP